MSIVLGGGRTTSKREIFWITIAILLIILAANHAFGCTSTRKPVAVRQPSHVVCTRCVVLGTFPDK